MAQFGGEPFQVDCDTVFRFAGANPGANFRTVRRIPRVFRGLRVGARLLWEQEVPSSNLGAPTFDARCPHRSTGVFSCQDMTLRHPVRSHPQVGAVLSGHDIRRKSQRDRFATFSAFDLQFGEFPRKPRTQIGSQVRPNRDFRTPPTLLIASRQPGKRPRRVQTS